MKRLREVIVNVLLFVFAIDWLKKDSAFECSTSRTSSLYVARDP
jgi:hypothetical protein